MVCVIARISAECRLKTWMRSNLSPSHCFRRPSLPADQNRCSFGTNCTHVTLQAFHSVSNSPTGSIQQSGHDGREVLPSCKARLHNIRRVFLNLHIRSFAKNYTSCLKIMGSCLAKFLSQKEDQKIPILVGKDVPGDTIHTIPFCQIVITRQALTQYVFDSNYDILLPFLRHYFKRQWNKQATSYKQSVIFRYFNNENPRTQPRKQQKREIKRIIRIYDISK